MGKPRRSASTADALKLQGVSENNLKHLTLDIPHDRLVGVTGLSGSGKSSLAFSTIYAEGQRRYIETFSPYTRQFFDKVKKPDVVTAHNVRPALAIRQRTKITGSRSTVGSVTDINELLKIIWSNLAQPFCPRTGVALVIWDAPRVVPEVARLLEHNAETVLVCGQIVLPKKRRLQDEELERLEKLGFSRYFDGASGTVKRFEEGRPEPDAEGVVLVVLDRVKRASPDAERRLLDSIGQAFRFSRGICTLVEISGAGAAAIHHYRSSYCHPDGVTELPFSVPNRKPGLFCVNSPIGACPDCKGFGKVLELDLEKIIPNVGVSLEDGALQCWTGEASRVHFKRMLTFCGDNEIPIDQPWKDLTAEQHALILAHRSRDYRGVLPWFKSLERKAYKMHVRVFLSRYRSQVDCTACGGGRLRPEAQIFRVAGLSLPELWDTPISAARDWLTQIGEQQQALPRELRDVVRALGTRFAYLERLGLRYLTLGRQSRTLSGGETQRVNLAAALGSELVSTQFVLDEPSVGLHPRDTERLIGSIRELQERGNSVLVVEHDLDCLAAADHIIELGPGAGDEGGEVTFSGPQASWTGVRASFDDQPAAPMSEPFPHRISIRSARARNLKGFDLELPLQRFIGIAGVSGSGKSTLVSEVLLRGQREYEAGIKRRSGDNRVNGLHQVDTVLLVDQSGLAKSPRANIATYSGIWERLRNLLAQTDAAQVRSLTKASFSFNVEGGRCPSCKGAGAVKEDMQFLSDVYVVCDVCLGKRFQEKTLEVTLRQRNAYDWLRTSVDTCAEVFFDDEAIVSAAQTLSELGLGHLQLGHPLSELSGGEAQRLKLVQFVEKSKRGKALLIFDEPTTGLHLRDVKRLLRVFRRLCDGGHTVLCVEHNQELLLSTDWIVDLGPEGGEAGGELVLVGPPSEFLKQKHRKKSLTAAYLQRYAAERQHPEQRSAATQRNTSATLRTICPPLTITGAREHNLKDVTVSIPHDTLVALTGVSGSGKSTIAKDIIYAEGQRRYLDCLSPYARQFVRGLSKPDIDHITNIRPTVCVYQHTFKPAKLSTLGTMSEVYNFLRLLFAKTGDQFCPDHPNQKVEALSSEAIAAEVARFGGTPVRLLAPIVKLKKGTHKAVFQRARRSDISEVRVDGVFGPPGAFDEGLERAKTHSIEFVWAKIVPNRIPQSLVREAIDEIFAIGGGTVIVHSGDSDTVFSRERACPTCYTGFFRPDPEDLSFHSRRGRCVQCGGRGVDLRGKPCAVCEGSRLNPIGRNIRIAGSTIYQASLLSAPELRKFLTNIEWPLEKAAVAAPVLREVLARLESLEELGLGYLPLNRSCDALSSGELQRLRLAAAMGTPLSGAMYIFDEPSAGLHPLDNQRVLGKLQDLRDGGNSVLLIEHDETSILSAEHIVEVGPGGGQEGGKVVYSGPRAGFALEHLEPAASEEVLTHAAPQYLSEGRLEIRNGSCNTIENLSLSIPLGRFVAVAGVSGAGKSSLVHGIVLDTLEDDKGKGKVEWQSEAGNLRATQPLDRVITVDQSPIGKNSRSTPASYLKIWDHVRQVFAGTIEARTWGWGPSFFSFNAGKGRCPECKGQGRIKLEMSFLSEAYVTCDFCGGSRYTAEALSARYLGHTVSDVLGMTFEEAKAVFSNHRKIHRALHTACDLGLGYLTLGQSSTTLSGGESQRIKLVSELARQQTGDSLYVLDEPTVGLHRRDVGRLLHVLRTLVNKGNTVIVIEHDHDVLRVADHVIELGPGPGARGGKVIFEGPPGALAKAKTPWGKLLNDGEPKRAAG